MLYRNSMLSTIYYITGIFRGYLLKVVVVVVVWNNIRIYFTDDIVIIIYDYLPSNVVMDCSNGSTATRYPAAIRAPLQI